MAKSSTKESEWRPWYLVTFNEKEQESFDDFFNHDCSRPIDPVFKNKQIVLRCVTGSIGTNFEVSCLCGKFADITDYECW